MSRVQLRVERGESVGASFKALTKLKKSPYDVIWASKSNENDDYGAESSENSFSGLVSVLKPAPTLSLYLL